MPPVVSKKLALAKIEDLIKLLNNEAKPIPFQEHHDSSLVTLHKLSNIFAPTSISTATTKKQSAVSTSKAQSVSKKSSQNLAHVHQLSRVRAPSKKSNVPAISTITHRYPTRSKYSPIAKSQYNVVMNPSTEELENAKV